MEASSPAKALRCLPTGRKSLRRMHTHFSRWSGSTHRTRRRNNLSDSLLEEMEAREQADWVLGEDDLDDIIRQLRDGRMGIAYLDCP